MVVYLVQDVAWMLGLGVMQCLHLRLWRDHQHLGHIVTGLLFGGVCVLGMSISYTPVPGVVINGFMVVLGIAGLFGGILAGGVAGLTIVLYRVWMGSGALVVTVLLVLLSVGLGVLYRMAVQRRWARMDVPTLLGFGLLLQLLRIGFLSQSPLPADQLLPVALGLVLVFTPATVLLAMVLQEGQRRDGLDEALRESEARFRTLIKDIPGVSVQAYAPDGTTRYWNKASEQLYGFSAEEALGRNLRELIIPAPMRDGVRQAMAHMFQTREAIPAGELVLQHKDGSRVPVFSSHAYVQAPGRVPEMFCVDIDLTARYRAEAELAIAATAFEALDAVVVTDPELRILRVNRAFTHNLGYTDADALGQTLALLKSERDTDVYFLAIQQALRRSGKWAGEIWSKRKNGEVFPQGVNINAVKDAAGEVVYFVITLSDITLRKAAEEQARQLAFYDPLTELPNRRLLMERLQRALASSERNKCTGALLFIDLDNFKTLNDTRGHDKGDLLLRQAAQRLLACIRECDTVARLGGDEFLVVLENLDSGLATAAVDVRAVGEKIVAALNRPYQLGDFDFNSTASVGVAQYNGMGLSVDELLKQADLAMYKAKDAGRNGMCFFDPAMQAVVNARAALEADLRLAIAHQQFELHYQPQVNGQGQVIGAEALLRWSHPVRGMVSPASFIPLAEDTGHILPLGRWVLEQACQQLQAWAQQPLLADVVLAVNVSARQFREADFVSSVLALLAATGASPQRLKLELTESMLVDNLEDMVGKMTALQAHGIGLSLDDFGTGYSSLSYLKRLPLDQLKIDQSFVRDVLTDPSDAAIARTVVALAHNLCLDVMAEGVETAAQKDFLAQCGCHAYQGYLFSRALPAAQFVAFAQRAQA